MPIGIQALAWTARLASLLLLTLTILPFVHTGWWVARAADFPRLQLLILSVACALLICLIALLSPWRREPWFWMSLCLLIAAWQASYVVRFTPLWPKTIGATPSSDFSLVIANLDFRNDSKAPCLDVLIELDADVYLLIETDEGWSNALAPLREALPYRVESIREKGLGIVLWSRLPLAAASIEHLVSEDRPSIHTVLELESGPIRFIGIHPTPPGLPVRGGSGRHDSRIRDAELMLVADQVASKPDERWIIAGDFNDVAWSRTTTLFAETSGLEDPRVGRSLLNTYHADHPLLRYPLDHIFVSDGFNVATFERVSLPGSDHFAVRAAFAVPEHAEGPDPNAKPEVKDAADDLIEDGRSDASGSDRSDER